MRFRYKLGIASWTDAGRTADHLPKQPGWIGKGRRGLHALTLEAKAFGRDALMGRTGFRMLLEGDDLVISGGRMIKGEYRSSMKAVFSLSSHHVKTFYHVIDVAADIAGKTTREFRNADELAWFLARM